MGRHLLVLAAAVWALAGWPSPAAAQAQPLVFRLPARNTPAIPTGWRELCIRGPYDGTRTAECPVLRYNGYTYWAWHGEGTRSLMAIVAYDAAGTAVKQWERDGATYLWRIVVNADKQTVTFVGAANTEVSFTWAELFVPSPASVPRALTFVSTSVEAVNCVFAPDCSVPATDTVTAIPFPPGISGSGQLQTRTFVGAPKSAAAGKTAYQYRVDLTQAVDEGEAACVTDLTLDFGSVSRLPYNGRRGYDVFVIDQGEPGRIRLLDVVQMGTRVTLTFARPICAGARPGLGQSSYFIGMASDSPPRTVTATLGWPGLDGLTMSAQTPAYWERVIPRAARSAGDRR